MEIDIIHYILIALVGVGAGFIQRVSGFGLGIFAMLFLPHFMPHTAAATISCLFSCGTSTYNAIKYKRHIPIRIVLPLICAAIVTIPIAVHFSVLVSGDFFEKLLGIILICLSIYFLFFGDRIKIKPTLKNSLIAGGTGGILNGLFSTGGPPIVLYLTQAVTDNIKYFAGIQFYFAVTNIYATILRIANGIVSWDLIVCATIGFIGCMLGDLIGISVFDKLNAKNLRTIIYIGMIISAILMFV